MFSWLMKRRIDAFERDYHYNASYVRGSPGTPPGSPL
jgi:hypothetical protein